MPWPLRSLAHTDVVESFLGPRDASTLKPIAYPPIDVHHVHMLPTIKTLRYHGEGPISDSYRQALVLERHGEWTRLGVGNSENGGMMTELEPLGPTACLWCGWQVPGAS